MIKYVSTVIFFICYVTIAKAACLNSIPESTPTSRFTNNADSTVTDTVTGLMWKKCSEGQSWDINTNTCTGTTSYFEWQEALQRAVDVSAGAIGENIGHSDWRVPNLKELSSILEYSCTSPSINVDVFPPDTSGDGRGNAYWTSTIESVNSGSMYTVSFRASGSIARPYNMSTPAPALRLVRDSQ